MRVFRQSYRDKKTGEAKKTLKWYIEFRDHEQTVRRWPAFRDKARSIEMGRKLEMLVHCRITGDLPDIGLNAWLETLTDQTRKRMGEIGLLDRRRLAANAPLSEHLDDFKESLIAKGSTAKHGQQCYNRIKRVFDGCKFNRWADITGSAVQNYLAQQQVGEGGIGAQTYNFYLQNVKQFCKWMIREQRASVSPVEHLAGQKVSADRRHERRALTVDEVQQLLTTTAASGVVQGMTGPGRAMLYRLAVESGLRSSEIRSLTRESFALDGEPVCVKVKAAYSKRRREDRVPMRPELANALRPMLAELAAGEQVFKMPRKENVARMLRHDLEAAGIPYRDANGKVADFHALRHTCGSWLMAANVHPKVIQQVMRHSTIKLTMDRYTHVFQSEEVQAVSQLPTLNASHGPAGASASGAATPDRSAENGAEKLGVSLGASGTKTCDSGRTDEINAAHGRADSGHEKSPNTLEKQGKSGLKRRGRDSIKPKSPSS